MKRILILTFYFLFFIRFSFAQAPEIQWQKTYGGSKPDDPDYLLELKNKEFLLAGSSASVDGDIIDHHGTTTYYDIWVTKIDSLQNIIWSQSYGGLFHDNGCGLGQTEDGGFIVAGMTNSVDGDVFVNHGLYDYWLFKIDDLGNLLWEKSFGGSDFDYARAMEITSDGGCILVGESNSVDGDVEGHHGAAGTSDIWVVKVNEAGELEWETSLGGTLDEEAFSIDLTDDGGYIIAGSATSNNGDVSVSYGSGDIWVVKISSDGNLVWEKSLGGSNSEKAFSINKIEGDGYIVGGNSHSNNIDVSGHHGTSSTADIWVVKINATGSIEWQKSFGGSKNEYLRDIKKLSDGNFIFTGFVYSTDGDVSFNHGDSDAWVVKIDPIGNIIWQKSLGGTKFDCGQIIFELQDYSIIVVANANSNNGDVTFNHGLADYWLINLEADCVPSPELCNYLDDNCNGLIDDAITESISITAVGPITFCQGGNVLLTATYSGAAVQWKKNGTNIPGAISSTYSATTKGNYTCVTTSACGTAESTPIFVNVIKNPNASISAGGPTTFCAGGSVVLTEAAVTGCTYQWYKGATQIVGATSIAYGATTSGNYKCRVTKTATGCFKNSNAIAVNVTCKEGENLDNLQTVFSIYPNPNNGTFTITTNNLNSTITNFEIAEFNITIYSSVGQLIYSEKLSSSSQTIKVGKLSAGIYFVRIGVGLNYSEQTFIVE